MKLGRCLFPSTLCWGSMRADLPHWSHRCQEGFAPGYKSPVGVSLEREIHLFNKLILTFPVFFRKNVLTHVVILIYFLYLNPKASQVPILLTFNISKEKMCQSNPKILFFLTHLIRCSTLSRKGSPPG